METVVRYIPGDKKPVEPPLPCRCAKCGHKLATGLAYFVIDSRTGREYPAGPDCFQQWTGRSPYAATVLALGAVRENAPSKAKDKKRTAEGAKAPRDNWILPFPSLSGAQNIAAQDPLESRRRAARANVLLRARVLPERGFSNTGAAQFKDFLPRIGDLGLADVVEIERRVASAEQRDERLSLEQLQCAYTVFSQIRRMLDAKGFYPQTRKHLMDFRRWLRAHNGLVDADMEKLKEWAALGARRFNVPNAVDAIAFPRNQTRYEHFCRFGPVQKPKQQAGQINFTF